MRYMDNPRYVIDLNDDSPVKIKAYAGGKHKRPGGI
jgi:hypothetical protein